MLPRHNRLPAVEIPIVMKFGKRVNASGITLIYREKREVRSEKGEEMTKRFAFIVSTKVDKRATVRNRIRRLMSESVRHVMDSIALGADGVMIGSKSLIGLTQKEVEMTVLDLFTRAGIYHDV